MYWPDAIDVKEVVITTGRIKAPETRGEYLRTDWK
jgi:hypothetical protein